MKTIILAAVAAAFVSNAHASEPTFAESCGHIENHTRFNPTELSEYQECWLGFHKPDEMAGVLGNIFWARAGDMTVSMPVSELRSAGSAEAAKALVVERVTEVIRDRVVIEYRDRIVERIEIQIEYNNEERDQLLAALNSGQDGLSMADAINRIQTLLTDQTALLDARDELSGITTWATFERVFNIHFTQNNLSAVLDDAIADARAAVTLITAENAPDHTFAGAAFSNATATETLVGDTHDVVDGDGNVVSTFTTHAAASSYILRNGLSETHSVVGRSLDTWSATVNGSTITFADSLFESQLVAQAVEAAYNVGYDDGYDEGYADGYADGFEDGVNSVGN